LNGYKGNLLRRELFMAVESPSGDAKAADNFITLHRLVFCVNLPWRIFRIFSWLERMCELEVKSVSDGREDGDERGM
jgi:hypothetical protein